MKREIIAQIADLSRLLGMIPSGSTSVRDARDSFLELPVLISQALDIRLPYAGLFPSLPGSAEGQIWANPYSPSNHFLEGAVALNEGRLESRAGI